MKLNLTCKEVAGLLIAREDCSLPLRLRLTVRMHLAICKTCPVFERQLLTMRNAMLQWRNYEPPDTPKDL